MVPENFPCPHTVHVDTFVWPGPASEYLPFSHATHVVASVIAAPLDHLPPAHRTHTAAEVWPAPEVEYDPGRHARHTSMDVCAAPAVE